MRSQPWKQTLNLRVQRTPMKYSKSFRVNSTFSRFYNAAKQKALETRKHQFEKRKTYASENRIIKRMKEERDKKENIHAFVELSRQYDALRAEQMNLERQIKKRTTVLIKAVHRHKKSTKILGDIERTLINYSKQFEKALSNYNFRAASGHTSMNDRTMEANHNNLSNSRPMGGSEVVAEYNSDFMTAFVKKFAAMRKYAIRWMGKANIKSRHSSAMDLATMIKKHQSMSWEPFRETIAVTNKEQIQPLLINEQYEREIALRSHSLTSFPDTSSYRKKQKGTGSLKSLLPTSEVVTASEDSSKLAKRRKKLKTKQSATSDIDEHARRQRTGKRRGGRGRRRSSRKSQQSTTSDGLKKGQKRRKIRRKNIKSLDSTGQDVKQGGRSQSVRKGRKRRSKEKSKLGKTSQESGSRAGTWQSIKDESITKQNHIFEANLLQQLVVAQTQERMTDKLKGKVVELDKTQSDTYTQVRALEEYWGVPLREDYTLRKLEHLNSILDELIVKEEEKPSAPAQLPSKHMLTSRKVIPKANKREMHDLEKLLILLKECKKCQKKQEKLKTAEQDCTVLCQKEYYDAIRNAAGLPDYFPEDSDFSLICSCNSLT